MRQDITGKELLHALQRDSRHLYTYTLVACVWLTGVAGSLPIFGLVAALGIIIQFVHSNREEEHRESPLADPPVGFAGMLLAFFSLIAAKPLAWEMLILLLGSGLYEWSLHEHEHQHRPQRRIASRSTTVLALAIALAGANLFRIHGGGR